MVSGPQSHLHPHHQPLPTEYQTTDQGRAAAEAYYNKDNSTMPPTSSLSLTSTIPLINSTLTMPRLGFGIYQSPPQVCVTSCLTALKAGYRHIDSAQFYRNESEMGAAVQKSGIPRSEVFLTTKILSSGGSPEKTYQKCLESVKNIDASQGGYVDLFLIHSPSSGSAGRKELWQALEKLVEEKKAKSIGVSNFGIGHIEEMKGYAKIWPPQVNQIEVFQLFPPLSFLPSLHSQSKTNSLVSQLHPWNQQREIVDYCNAQKIVIQAYCPLVRNMKAYDETLVSISKKHGKTTGQVLIRYCLQKGWVPLPKSDTPSRIEANADVYGFDLDKGDMGTLDGLDQGAQGAIVQAVDNE
ncbi:MAG: hypothetical protein L6R41_002562 [Letrouitia leprolyta]|nr:MAG: hypothetical protein L6R41_002562 [Letrouitia leprolyta]